MSTPPLPAPAASAEDRRQHLGFVQSAIGRMSSASAVAKGWALTIATTAYGYAGTKHSILVALLGIFAVLLFAALDTRYLREERKYRTLYDAARAGRVGAYEMNATRYCGTLTKAERRSLSLRRVIWSWSVRDYYGVIVLVGAVLLVWISFRSG